MNNEPILLIVDDSEDLLEMYQDVLQLDGVKTVVANSGSKALEICINSSNVKFVISDCNMGEMSGMDLLKHLNTHFKSSMPPFYLLTGAFDISEETIKKEGGTGLVLKPFDLDEMLEKIKKEIKL